MNIPMKLSVINFLALFLIINAEEENIIKRKRSIPYVFHEHTPPLNYYSVNHPYGIGEDQSFDFFNLHGHWLYNSQPHFYGFPSFGTNGYPVIFGDNIYTPGLTLATTFSSPLNIHVAPSISIPKVVTPRPQSAAPIVTGLRQPSQPVHGATSAGTVTRQPPLPASPPIPAPIQPASQVGRLGSGSLGYVHLGNGLYALGSGSLGYTPPAAAPVLAVPAINNQAGGAPNYNTINLRNPNFSLNNVRTVFPNSLPYPTGPLQPQRDEEDVISQKE